MNPLCLAGEIWIHGANDDARVLRLVAMQSDEVTAIQGQQSAVFSGGKLQHFVIRQGLIGFAGFLNGQQVMTERAEFLDDGKGKVLVGLKPRHHSASFASI